MEKSFRYWLNLGLFGLIALILGLGMSLTGLSYQGVQGYIHPQRSLPMDTPAYYGISYQDVILETADGLRLSGWFTPPENGAVILVAHGHARHRWSEMHVFFAEAGYGVLSWDFRAHGASEGDLSTIGYYEALDVEAALNFALQQEGVDHIGAWGGSMGGAAVILAAARRPEIEAVVADSAFAAIEDELEIVVKISMMRPLVRFILEQQTGLKAEMLKPEDQIGKISPRPVFIIQGLADRVIAVDSAERLYSSAGEPRFVWEELNVGHLGMRQTYPELYTARVIEFFNLSLLDKNY
jgi:fermentation-respiration switch protein FrsA (DUF1100 family)